jgi:hypothetical protein
VVPLRARNGQLYDSLAEIVLVASVVCSSMTECLVTEGSQTGSWITEGSHTALWMTGGSLAGPYMNSWCCRLLTDNNCNSWERKEVRRIRHAFRCDFSVEGYLDVNAVCDKASE